VFGVAAGQLLLGEQLTVRQWLGAVVVIAAVSAVVRSTRQTSHRRDAGRADLAVPSPGVGALPTEEPTVG
jgi:hypothetical protein